MQQLTIAQIRALTTITDPVFFTTDKDQEGLWQYDSLDTVSTDNTGTVLVTANSKRIKRVFDGPVNVNWFGAKGDGVTDDSAAIQLASNAMVNSKENRLKFNGNFKLTVPINLKSGVHYDLGDASFFLSSKAAGDYIFKGQAIVDFKITGGIFNMETGSVKITTTTGQYTDYVAIYLFGCDNFSVSGIKVGRLYVGINLYNSTNYAIHHNYFKDCNAGIANVAQTSYTVRNFMIHDNIIESCGDDGIYCGSTSVNEGVGGTCKDFIITENIITKKTRTNGELNGSVFAAVGIRIGSYEGSTVVTKNFSITNNRLLEMVSQAILIHDCDTAIIDGNIVDGYAKNGTAAAPAIQIGDPGKPAVNVTATNNIVKNAVTNNAEFKLADVTNLLVQGNHFLGGVNRTTKMVRTDAQVSVVIIDNKKFVTENSGTCVFPWTATWFDFVHGLDDITNIFIEVVPLINLGSAQIITVTNITPTAFRINLDQVTGGTVNPTFFFTAKSNWNLA